MLARLSTGPRNPALLAAADTQRVATARAPGRHGSYTLAGQYLLDELRGVDHTVEVLLHRNPEA